jgi:phosphate transport system ATP-binding protein
MMTDDVTISTEVGPVEIAQERKAPAPTQREVVFEIRDLGVTYGSTTAISGVNLEIYRNYITAMIGPSGCGKSTFIRCLNRMNDLVAGAKVDGHVLYHGQDI